MIARLRNLEFILKQQDQIHLRDAAIMLSVSEMTIRRDINSGKTPFNLLGGYIVLKNPKTHYQVIEQQTKNIREKLILGEKVAKLVKKDDIVFFDCGSTITFIASQINPELSFTAICCSINTFNILANYPNCKLILLGGEFSRNNALFQPINIPNELELIFSDKAFISAAGFSQEKGATCFDLVEAKLKRQAISKTKNAILVADSSKKDTVQKAFICKLSEFNQIITEL